MDAIASGLPWLPVISFDTSIWACALPTTPVMNRPTIASRFT
jgi:hypothetical protein